MQGNNDPHRVDMPAARLALIAERSKVSRGRVPALSHYGSLLHRDMFQVVWGPAVQAAASLLEAAHAHDDQTISGCLRVFRTVRSAAAGWTSIFRTCLLYTSPSPRD